MRLRTRTVVTRERWLALARTFTSDWDTCVDLMCTLKLACVVVCVVCVVWVVSVVVPDEHCGAEPEPEDKQANHDIAHGGSYGTSRRSDLNKPGVNRSGAGAPLLLHVTVIVFLAVVVTVPTVPRTCKM